MRRIAKLSGAKSKEKTQVFNKLLKKTLNLHVADNN